MSLGLARRAVVAVRRAAAATATVTDTFNRANSTTTLGNADTGQAWAVFTTGAVFGITGNQAYMVSSTNGTTTADWVAVDSTVADCTAQITVAVAAANCGLAARLSDENNTLLVNVGAGNALRLFRRAGSYVELGGSGSVVSSDVIALTMSGSTLQMKKNGVVILTVTETLNQTQTRHGFQINDAASGIRFDDFAVTVP